MINWYDIKEMSQTIVTSLCPNTITITSITITVELPDNIKDPITQLQLPHLLQCLITFIIDYTEGEGSYTFV